MSKRKQTGDEAVAEVLTCRKCRATLSLPLADWKPQKNPRPLTGDCMIPAGMRYVANSPYRPSTEPLGFMPQTWMNPDDVLPAVGYSAIEGRMDGCCGPDGGQGPNRTCPCGAHVGTEVTDCMYPWVFIPEPEKTGWRAAS